MWKVKLIKLCLILIESLFIWVWFEKRKIVWIELGERGWIHPYFFIFFWNWIHPYLIKESYGYHHLCLGLHNLWRKWVVTHPYLSLTWKFPMKFTIWKYYITFSRKNLLNKILGKYCRKVCKNLLSFKIVVI